MKQPSDACHELSRTAWIEANAAKTVPASIERAPRGRPQENGTASTTTSAGDNNSGQSEEAAPSPQLTPEKLPNPILDGLRVLTETLFKP